MFDRFLAVYLLAYYTKYPTPLKDINSVLFNLNSNLPQTFTDLLCYCSQKLCYFQRIAGTSCSNVAKYQAGLPWRPVYLSLPLPPWQRSYFSTANISTAKADFFQQVDKSLVRAQRIKNRDYIQIDDGTISVLIGPFQPLH